jgi:hypothetical protein
MRAKRISELPRAREIPGQDELVVPVFQDGTSNVMYQILVSELARLIREAVLVGEEIAMVESVNGIKFVRKQSASNATS